jgi:hypothetical protein
MQISQICGRSKENTHENNKKDYLLMAEMLMILWLGRN